MKRRWLIPIFALVACYLVVCAVLYVRQDSFIFQPQAVSEKLLEARAKRVGAQVAHLQAKDGTKILAWHIDGGHERTVVYFHGNASDVTGSLALAEALPRLGWSLITMSYRGYPGSEGQASSQGMVQDADALWAFAVAQGYAPDRIVLHGKSLGGGVASQLAASKHPAGLVLESTFTSLRARAQESYPFLPVRLLLRHRFDTAQVAASIGRPTLILHGDADRIVPVEHGRVLSELFVGSSYLELAGARHNQNLWEIEPGRAAYVAFLDGIAGTDPDQAPVRAEARDTPEDAAPRTYLKPGPERPQGPPRAPLDDAAVPVDVEQE